MPFKKGNNKAARKTVSAESLKAYKRAAAAADKKVTAAELAFDSDPSEENKVAVQQARAKACAASAKLRCRPPLRRMSLAAPLLASATARPRNLGSPLARVVARLPTSLISITSPR